MITLLQGQATTHSYNSSRSAPLQPSHTHTHTHTPTKLQNSPFAACEGLAFPSSTATPTCMHPPAHTTVLHSTRAHELVSTVKESSTATSACTTPGHLQPACNSQRTIRFCPVQVRTGAGKTWQSLGRLKQCDHQSHRFLHKHRLPPSDSACVLNMLSSAPQSTTILCSHSAQLCATKCSPIRHSLCAHKAQLCSTIHDQHEAHREHQT